MLTIFLQKKSSILGGTHGSPKPPPYFFKLNLKLYNIYLTINNILIKQLNNKQYTL